MSRKGGKNLQKGSGWRLNLPMQRECHKCGWGLRTAELMYRPVGLMDRPENKEVTSHFQTNAGGPPKQQTRGNIRGDQRGPSLKKPIR